MALLFCATLVEFSTHYCLPPTMPPIDSMLRQLFTVPVGLCAGSVAGDGSDLYPEELVAVERAVPKRVAEYAAGRRCARAALAQLGVAACALPSRSDRTPQWPEGYTGSISHTATRCVAVAVRLDTVASVGIDVEPALLADAALYPFICRADQLAELAARTELPLPAWMALVFSAKEAFYKAYYPLMQRFLEFDEVRVTFSVDADSDGVMSGSFRADVDGAAQPLPAGLKAQGCWLRDGEHVYTGVTCGA